jgi:hypothetical protein
MGCAAYGCDQVNALAPKEEQSARGQCPSRSSKRIEPLPWSFLLLGAATLALLISAITTASRRGDHGAAGGGCCKKRHLHDRPLLWALILAVAGCFSGHRLAMWWARDYTK